MGLSNFEILWFNMGPGPYGYKNNRPYVKEIAKTPDRQGDPIFVKFRLGLIFFFCLVLF